MTQTFPLDRRAPDQLGRMVWMSLGVHLLAVTVLFVIPRAWFTTSEPELMKITISLGGGAENTAGGKTSAGSRAIQEVAPPPKRPAPVLPATPPKTTAACQLAALGQGVLTETRPPSSTATATVHST